MFSLSCAVWEWLAESANILLDLAVSGRAANNAFVIAIAAGLAIFRLTAFLLFVIPGFLFLKKLIIVKVKDKNNGEILRVRVAVVVLIIVSIVFEICAVPGRNGNTETAVETRIETERG